ncbi:HNH endonuclease [Janthinobacterium lividum]|uniref:HNH endonuclease n=1 Tax=Janthinobacterium lividum TaxID=29581 RepID=UPI0009B8011B|nr:HNH endonuclease signature motif containing protein [Janthinobacterium lividum]
MVTKIMTPIELARSYVHETVQGPALQSELSESIKNKVRHSDVWLAKFKRVGDLLAYLKRFDIAHDDPIYKAMKEVGLLTFEDIVEDFEVRFGQWATDCSRISDFVIGEQYSVYDILILARNYDTRAGGMFVLEADDKPVAVVIKASLNGGRYANEWIEEPTKLKYYLKSIKGEFGEHFKANAAIINTEGLPILTFVRESNDDPFVFKGLFRYDGIIREDDQSKAFVLSLNSDGHPEVVSASKHVAESLRHAVADSAASSREQRLLRLGRAPKKPATIQVVSTAYARNADVIAEVLYRAQGLCESCEQPAPFIRKADATPYLEVHHRTPLAKGGDDTVENAIALCPNCHRKSHYG